MSGCADMQMWRFKQGQPSYLHICIRTIIFAAAVIKIHLQLKAAILRMLDFFYPPFRSIMPLQTFRYAVCGGSTTSLNIFIFFLLYNFVLDKKIIHLSFFSINSYIAAYLISFLITFPIGFYLSLFVVFPGSKMRKRTKLFRYFVVVLICILLNYLFLKLFVDVFGWYPTPSLMLTAVLVIAFSYFSQRHFSFRKKMV